MHKHIRTCAYLYPYMQNTCRIHGMHSSHTHTNQIHNRITYIHKITHKKTALHTCVQRSTYVHAHISPSHTHMEASVIESVRVLCLSARVCVVCVSVCVCVRSRVFDLTGQTWQTKHPLAPPRTLSSLQPNKCNYVEQYLADEHGATNSCTEPLLA